MEWRRRLLSIIIPTWIFTAIGVPLRFHSIIQSELHHVRQTTRYIQSPTRRRTQKPCLPLGSSSGRIHVAGLGRRFGLGFLLGFPFLVKLNPIGSIIFLQNKLTEFVCTYSKGRLNILSDGLFLAHLLQIILGLLCGYSDWHASHEQSD